MDLGALLTGCQVLRGFRIMSEQCCHVFALDPKKAHPPCQGSTLHRVHITKSLILIQRLETLVAGGIAVRLSIPVSCCAFPK